MAVFVWSPTFDTAQEREAASEPLRLGDGYTLRPGPGLRPLPRRLQARFLYPMATAQALDAFLREHAGTLAFEWQAPSGPGHFVCPKWSFRALDKSGLIFGEVQAVFEEVFL